MAIFRLPLFCFLAQPDSLCCFVRKKQENPGRGRGFFSGPLRRIVLPERICPRRSYHASYRFRPHFAAQTQKPAARQMHTAGTLYLLFWLFCAITRSISCWVCMTSSWKLLAETRTAPWPRMISCSKLSDVATRTFFRPRSS